MIRLSSDMSPQARRMRRINKAIDICKYVLLVLIIVAILKFIIARFF